MRSINVLRKAVLIGSPGNVNSNYLPGVGSDIHNMRTFLCSDRGGKWHEEEIMILENPDVQGLLAYIQNIYADYVFVYFSGHGYTDRQTGYRMLCINNSENVADVALTQTAAPRLMLINDACRNIPKARISGFPIYEDHNLNFTGDNTFRELFNDYINNSPYGKVIIHGTAAGEFAMDSSSGGYFTQALLHVASKMNIDAGYQTVRIDEVLSHVPSLLEERGNHQKFEFINFAGDLQVPFCIAVPLRPKLENFQKPARQLSNESASAGWRQLLVGLGLVVAGCYLFEE